MSLDSKAASVEQVRLHSLDYLRGIMACGIMIYHYTTWSYGGFDAATVLGRIGIYGVSIFYILSGLTLFHVYHHRLSLSRQGLVGFFKKRVLRIFPLLWLATLTAIALVRKQPDVYDLFLNLTGLFGFLSWDTYFSAGIWSIGNELVFYSLFPFILLASRRSNSLFATITAAFFIIYIYFAFMRIDSSVSLAAQWRDYVNPLNQAFLFVGGMCIGRIFQHRYWSNTGLRLMLIIALLLFFFLPVEGDTVRLITGYRRLLFTAAGFLLCTYAYKTNISDDHKLHRPLKLLGEASYSVYLIHPLVYDILIRIRNHSFPFPDWILMTIGIIITLLTSYFIYQYFERYFIGLGRRTSR